jgi:hypothetical protein
MKEQNEGREIREERTTKGIQDKINKRVKIKKYKGGTKCGRKTLNGGKKVTNTRKNNN